MIERARHDRALRLGAARHPHAAQRLGPDGARGLGGAIEIPARHQIGRAHAELQSLMRISYAVFCLKKKKNTIDTYDAVVDTKTRNTKDIQHSKINVDAVTKYT